MKACSISKHKSPHFINAGSLYNGLSFGSRIMILKYIYTSIKYFLENNNKIIYSHNENVLATTGDISIYKLKNACQWHCLNVKETTQTQNVYRVHMTKDLGNKRGF